MSHTSEAYKNYSSELESLRAKVKELEEENLRITQENCRAATDNWNKERQLKAEQSKVKVLTNALEELERSDDPQTSSIAAKALVTVKEEK